MSTATKRRKGQRRPPQKTTPRPPQQSRKLPVKTEAPVQKQTPSPVATPAVDTKETVAVSPVAQGAVTAPVVQLPKENPTAQETSFEHFVIKGTLPGKRRIRKSRKRAWPATVLTAESSQVQLHLISQRLKKQRPTITLCLQSVSAGTINKIVETLRSFAHLERAVAIISPAKQDWTITGKGSEQEVLTEFAQVLSLGLDDAGEDSCNSWILCQNTKTQSGRGAEKSQDNSTWLGAVALVVDDTAQLSQIIQTALRKTDVDVVVIIDHDITVLIPATATDTDELTLEIAKLRLHLAGEHIHAVRVTDQRLLRHLARQMGRPL